MIEYTIATFYHFVRLKNCRTLQTHLKAVCQSHSIKGTLLLAKEGFNATIAGLDADVQAVIAVIGDLTGCHFVHRHSRASFIPFQRMKVKIKQEIVALKQPDVDPTRRVGTYISPKAWDDFIAGDDVVMIDTRNDYEIEIGTFKGAINPNINRFSAFPSWWQNNKARFAHKKIAMFCTGGIRCEKSTAYLLNERMHEVYHLRGGILQYLQDVVVKKNYWQGECFVFDGRVSVSAQMRPGCYYLCYACRMPLAPQDLERIEFEPGVHCHRCIYITSAKRKSRFRQRQKQIELAKRRGTVHFGA